MSTTHDIDNYDEALFQFDPFDSHQSLLGMSPSSGPPTIPARAASLPSDVDIAFGPTEAVDMKGKGRTMPMPIRQPTIVRDLFELSSQSYDSSSSVMICSPSTSNFSSDSNSLLGRHCSFLTDDREQAHSLDSASGSYTGKGKERALFPMLPPLTFSNIDLDYDQVPLTPDDGASPTIHDHGSVTDIPISLPLHVHSSETGASLSKPPVSRCQSLSNLSHQAFAPSTGSPSTAIASSTFEPGALINRSRQHLEMFEKDSLAIDHPSLTLDLQLITGELDNHLPAWYTTPKPSDTKTPRELFRPKGRSRSSPYPISALDIIPDTSTDIFQPLPIIIHNYFDLVLPKELRLHILRALVDLHEDDHQRSISERRFTVAKATSSRGRWVGRDKGIRELFKFSRVCL